MDKLNEQQLDTLCDTYKIKKPTGKKTKSVRISLKNAVCRFLSSEEVEDEEDEGLEIFTNILEDVIGFLAEEIEEKPLDSKLDTDIKHGGGGSDFSDEEIALKMIADGEKMLRLSASRNSVADRKPVPKVEYTKLKLREFKINGGNIGGTDGSGSIDWNSLNYQIREGLELGYSKREIMSGVIKAIKSGSSLRKYFEGKPNIAWDSFVGILKAHCNVVTASALLDQMGVSVQEPTENALDFVLRMMNMRDTILESRTEDDPIGSPHIQNKFTRTLDVGLRSPTVRLELKPLILNPNTTDDDLVEGVTKVMVRKAENEKKTGKSKSASVKVLGVDDAKSDPILIEIAKLTAIVAENQRYIQEMRTQFNKDKKRRLGSSEDDKEKSPTPVKSKKPFRFPKCAQCEKKHLFCKHCSKCGADDHKRNACPKNTQ